MNVVIMMLGTTATLWERGPWLGDWATQPSLMAIEVRTMKRSKMTAAKNSLSPTMKSRAPKKHAIQGEEAVAELAPQLSAANTQKLVRLVRNCGIETVIGVAKCLSENILNPVSCL